jgi:hypothetical protein
LPGRSTAKTDPLPPAIGLQTVPGKGWNTTIFRINGTLEPWFDKTWKPGEIERVK